MEELLNALYDAIVCCYDARVTHKCSKMMEWLVAVLYDYGYRVETDPEWDTYRVVRREDDLI